MTSPEGAPIPVPAQEEFDDGAREFVEGNNDVALAHFLKAVELHPGFSDAYYMLALAQMRTGDSASAAESLEKVIEATPNLMLREYAQKHLSRLKERG